MICALYRERQEKLPETPAELCEALVQMLLHRRERETPGLQDSHFPTAWRSLQYSQKKGLLAEIAWRMVCNGDSSISSSEASELVEGILLSTPGRTKDETHEVLQALVERSGLLRPSREEGIDFLHNTLKEYLAAGRIVEEGRWDFLVEHVDDPSWQPVMLFTLALGPEQFSTGLVGSLLSTKIKPTDLSRITNNPSKLNRAALGKHKARIFFLVRCQTAVKRLAIDLTETIDKFTSALFPPWHMPEVEALAQLGSRILVHEEKNLMNPGWWTRQDCRMILRCLRLLRLIGGPKAAAVARAIKRLPSLSAQVTGEWAMVSSELCSSSLPWPFRNKMKALLDGTRVCDLAPLTKVPGLQDISLASTQVQDISPLSIFSELTHLDIQRTRVTSLAPLRSLLKLRVLILFNTPIQSLAPLADIGSLKFVYLTKSMFNDDEIASLAKARPDIQMRTSDHGSFYNWQAVGTQSDG
jgi:hypothetical protein